MSHSFVGERRAIFKAINVGMASAFYEDNSQTRVFCLNQWMMEENCDVKEIRQNCKSDETYAKYLASCARDGVLEGLYGKDDERKNRVIEMMQGEREKIAS